MTDNCQVDFYVLGSSGKSPGRLACRLALMAWEQGNRIAVLTENTADAKQLDELMWESPAERFLPHSTDFMDQSAPVRIGTAETDLPVDCEVLINLTAAAVPEPSRFRRLLEIVPATESERTASREKFRAYRNLGLRPVSHTIG
jgi:DNA polymerase-3 subunit chi